MRRTKKLVRSAFSVALAASLAGTSVIPSAAASPDAAASAQREAANAEISQYAATQGMVLLENRELENGSKSLPISQEKGTKIALFGVGAYKTVKGGTGSGDVYLKDGANISVLQGLEDAGYRVVTNQKVNGATTSFLDDRLAEYENADTGSSAWGSYAHNEPAYAADQKSAAEVDAAAEETQTAIYVLARNSGEGTDRSAAKNDYYLTDEEAANLKLLGQKFENVIVVLNTGGILDTNFFNGKGGYDDQDSLNRGKIEGLDSLVLMSQAGMNGGHALVEVLNGTVTPSGKLTDTWAVNYEDYPSSEAFSNRDGNTNEEVYTDDIYVGYRYFDTFGKDVAYEFGYGQSYTDFSIHVDEVTADEKKVTVQATITNNGTVDGKEVVEVYFSAPEGDLDKPYQELAGYQKVSVAAKESEQVTVTFDTADMSSYDEGQEAYVLEDGTYTIRVGNSSRNSVEAAELTLSEDVVTEYCDNELGLTKDAMQAGDYSSDFVMSESAYVMDMLDETSEGYGTGITPKQDGITAAAADKIALEASGFGANVTHEYDEGAVTTYVSTDAFTDSYAYGADKASTADEKLAKVKAAEGATLKDVVDGKISVEQLVADMSNVELADLVEGGTYDGLAAGTTGSAVIGSQADSVYGAAGETTSNLYNSRYIPNIVLSDGPAGIRITNSYIQYTLISTDAPYDANTTYYTAEYSWAGNTYTEAAINSEADYNALIQAGTSLYTTDGVTYYQYCTAFPIGTMLAQTWDPEVIEMVGRAVGVEMLEYGVTSWLAPGMNIHRNPLCGRNFEYYSEDPLVCGITAAAETTGVETDENGNSSGVGVTLKHFAFNNQEEQRMGSNSVVSERAAREIYLKGFEIGVKKAQPDYIMSSYNMVNGYSTFEHYGLLTEILRNEWDFQGFVMTDWYSVFGVNQGSAFYGENVQAHLMRAGNDCEMPGGNEQNILDALKDGTLRLGDLQKSAINMLNVIKDTAVFRKLQTKLQEAETNAAQTAAKEAQAALKEAQAAAEAAKKALEEAEKIKAQAGADSAAAKEAMAAAQKAQAAAEKALEKAEFMGKKAGTKKAVSNKKKQMKVTWKKVSGASGYVVQYSTKSNFKKAKTKVIQKGTAASTTIKKLKSNKTYYVRVRAYKSIDGKKVYTSYSAKKHVKVK